MRTQARARIRGVVILYATIAVGMLGVLGTTMSDGSQAAVDAVQASVFTQMARYAAESGIETAIAALDAHLAVPCGKGLLVFDPVVGRRVPATTGNSPACRYGFRPCTDANTTISWADGEDGTTELVCSGADNRVSLQSMFPDGWDSPEPPLTTSGAEADRERIAQRYITSFRLSMKPSFNGTNVRLKIMLGNQAEFVIRSRGMVRGGKDPDVSTGRILLAQAVLVAKVRVGEGCKSTASGDRNNRMERLSMDLVPAYERPGLPAKLPGVYMPH